MLRHNSKNFGEIVPDFTLFLTICITLLYGTIILYSASNNDTSIIFSHLAKIFLGLIIMIVISKVNINLIITSSPYIYAISLFFLFLVFISGTDVKGASRWISLFGFNFQPSEILKISLPMILCWYVSIVADDKKRFLHLIVLLIITFLPILFVIRQPDLGMSTIALMCALITLFLSYFNLQNIIIILTLFLTSIPLVWKYFLLDYQKSRILTMLDPSSDPLGSGWNIIQSKIAIGSGGFFGKGLFNGTQTKLEFLPERSNDFIFAVLSEELGFIGVLLLFILYLIIIYRCFLITQKTKNNYGKILSGSLLLIFIMLFTINIGMCIGLFPVVGITLPLISQGGSFIVTTLALFGVIMSVGHKS